MISVAVNDEFVVLQEKGTVSLATSKKKGSWPYLRTRDRRLRFQPEGLSNDHCGEGVSPARHVVWERHALRKKFVDRLWVRGTGNTQLGLH